MSDKIKKTFLLYYDQSQVWDGLPDDMAGKVIKLLHKKLKELPPDIDPLVKYAYDIIKKKIDDDYEKWLERCNKNRENVKKRWKAKQNERIQSHTNVSDDIRSGTIYTDNDNDNDNDNEHGF